MCDGDGERTRSRRMWIVMQDNVNEEVQRDDEGGLHSDQNCIE